MEEKKNIPEIRFKGFEGEWEQKQLKDISFKVIEKNTYLVYSETFTNSAEYGIISQRDYFDNDISNSCNLNRYYVVKNDDFVYNPRISSFALVGPINRNKLGRAGVMSPIYTVFRTQNVITSFLEYFFKTTLWHAFMMLNGDTGARSDRFSIKDSLFIEMPISFPIKKEQSQIGSFFKDLDKQITLEQQKHDKLVTLKKAMLEKMFPKEGEDVPEIRFKGFEEKWESTELKELVDVRSGRDYKNLKNGSIPVYGTGGYMLSVNEALSYYEDAIGIGRKGTIDKPFILYAPFWTVDTLFYAVPFKMNDLFFLNCLFQNINWKLKDESTGVPSLSRLAINRVSTKKTSYKEQTKIGSYFQNLDKLISLQQKKIDKLKNIKKACLEKMFV